MRLSRRKGAARVSEGCAAECDGHCLDAGTKGMPSKKKVDTGRETDNDESYDLYAVRLRLRSKGLSLLELRQISGIRGNAYSFSKGDRIPKFLTQLERRDYYDTSMLQVAYDCQSQSDAERTLGWLLNRYRSRLRKIALDKRIESELAIEIWDDSPSYFKINQRLVHLTAELSLAILIVSG